MGWEDATFKNSPRKLVHIEIPGFKGIAVGKVAKDNIKQYKKKVKK